jgi:hypothetical protein
MQATLWPVLRVLLALRRASGTSQQVACTPILYPTDFTIYRVCSVSTLVVQWYE